MSQLAALLHQFADAVGSGKQFKGAVHCAVVLANDKGETQATYIGGGHPAQCAGVHLLANGIINWNNDVMRLVTSSRRSST